MCAGQWPAAAAELVRWTDRGSLPFEYEADRQFFKQLLCKDGEELALYADLFDFRPAHLKRREFGRLRAQRLRDLQRVLGSVCLLYFAPDCSVRSGLTVDHLIPLSSNVLNKGLRGVRTSRTADGALRKVPSQTLGSNNPRNLILACCNCNSFKKDRLPDKDTIKYALEQVSRV